MLHWDLKPYLAWAWREVWTSWVKSVLSRAREFVMWQTICLQVMLLYKFTKSFIYIFLFTPEVFWNLVLSLVLEMWGLLLWEVPLKSLKSSRGHFLLSWHIFGIKGNKIYSKSCEKMLFIAMCSWTKSVLVCMGCVSLVWNEYSCVWLQSVCLSGMNRLYYLTFLERG